jgi:hypothetical protein
VLSPLFNLLLAALPTDAPRTIAVDERTPSILLVTAPGGMAGGGHTSSLLRAASAAFAAHTDLRLLSPEQAGADLARFAACDRLVRLSCWVRAVRPEASGTPEAPSPDSDEDLRFLVVLASAPTADGRLRLSPMLIDTDRALEAIRALRPGAGGREAAEDAVFAGAERAASETIDPKDEAALDGYFRALVTRSLRSSLERTGHWSPQASLSLRTGAAGLGVRVDGRLVGTSGTGETLLTGLRAGRRELELVGPRGATSRVLVDLRPGEVHAVLLEPPRATATGAARPAALWGGLAVGVIGASLTAVGLAQQGRIDARCLVRASEPDAGCPSLGYVSTRLEPDAAPTADPSRVDPGSFALAPLGFGLLGLGATTAVGTWLFTEAEEPPWWPLVAGLVVGGAAFAVGASL